MYNQYEVINCSKSNHEGDLHLQIDNNFILFECKYKEVITKDDITKFYNDITVLQNSGRDIIGAIFISIKSNNIPKIGNIKIEKYGNIFTLFLAFPDEDTCIEKSELYIKLFTEFVITNIFDAKKINGELNMYKIESCFNNLRKLDTSLHKLATTYAKGLIDGIKTIREELFNIISELENEMYNRENVAENIVENTSNTTKLTFNIIK